MIQLLALKHHTNNDSSTFFSQAGWSHVNQGGFEPKSDSDTLRRSVGGTDVSDLKYMKMKQLLKDRGVDPRAVDSCAGVPSLVVLGQKHGVLSPPEVKEMEAAAKCRTNNTAIHCRTPHQ